MSRRRAARSAAPKATRIGPANGSAVDDPVTGSEPVAGVPAATTATPPCDGDDPEAGEADLATAHEHFETAVGVGELSLPEAFAGTTPFARPTNRPWLLALHGLVTCRRRAGATDAAVDVEDTLLCLDPADPLGPRTSVLTPF